MKIVGKTGTDSFFMYLYVAIKIKNIWRYYIYFAIYYLHSYSAGLSS
jgi:hypothetical protein